MSVVCGYCKRPARLVHGPELYPHRRDLAHVKAWRCDACNAQVGCHDGTETPKGTLAKPDLMRARQAVHRAFDPLWQNWREAYPEENRAPDAVVRRIARSRAYDWLTHQMGRDGRQVHIGAFDDEHCAVALELIQKFRPTPVSIRAWAKARKADK